MSTCTAELFLKESQDDFFNTKSAFGDDFLVVMQCGWCRGNPCGCPLWVRVATFEGNHKGCPYQEHHPHCITTDFLSHREDGPAQERELILESIRLENRKLAVNLAVQETEFL